MIMRVKSGFNRSFFRKQLDVDIEKEFDRLKSVGRIPADQLKDRNRLAKEINRASYLAFRANLIYLKARKERELFRIEFNKEMRELQRLAIARINTWFDKTATVRKQITKDMIDQEICAGEDTGERLRIIKEREEEIREIRDALDNLAKQWSTRVSSLQTQARLASAQKEVVLGGTHG